MGHKLTLVCDICELEYMMEDGMELPPYWIGLQLVVSDKDGYVPISVKDVFMHICSIRCLSEVSEHPQIKARRALIDKISKEELDEEDN